MYKAIDKATDEVVAIKVSLPCMHALQAQLRARAPACNTAYVHAPQVISLADQPAEDFSDIQKEIVFLSGCSHPNVVRYLVRAARAACMHAWKGGPGLGQSGEVGSSIRIAGLRAGAR